MVKFKGKEIIPQSLISHLFSVTKDVNWDDRVPTGEGHRTRDLRLTKEERTEPLRAVICDRSVCCQVDSFTSDQRPGPVQPVRNAQVRLPFLFSILCKSDLLHIGFWPVVQ